MAPVILCLALTLAVLEGAIRKWIIGSEAGPWSYLAYFSKDIVFASVLLFPKRLGTTPALIRFGRWLWVGSGLILFGGAIACCRACNPIGAALTFRATIALPVIAYAAVPRLSGLRLVPIAMLLAVLTCANCGLGIAQNQLPVDSALNRYVSSEADVAALESGIRATGTFSYITGLALLSSIGIWAAIVLASFKPSALWQLAATVAILAAIGCGLASVSRGPILMGGLLLASWACSKGHRRREFFKLGWALFLVGMAAVVLGLAGGTRKMAKAVLERHEQGDDTVQNRVFGQLGQMAAAAFIAPLGQGLGTEQVAANYAIAGVMKFTTFEEQMPRLVLETGVAGAVGFVIICCGAIVSLQVAKRSTTDSRLQAVLLATQVLLGCLFYTNVVFNHTASAFAWMIFAAVMAAVPPVNQPFARAPLSQFRNRFRRAGLT